jgi:mannose-6-phosphate isomerase-like protein (cupin superfamily)
MLIKKNQAEIVDLGAKIIRKYTAFDKQLEVNHMVLNGRTPEESGAFLRETKVHFMAYVTKGNGKIFMEEEIFEVGVGDCVDVPPGTKFAAEGNFEYITAENPAWYPEQAQIVDKNGNKVLVK